MFSLFCMQAFLLLKIQLLNHYVLIKSLISLNCEKLPRPKI